MVEQNYPPKEDKTETDRAQGKSRKRAGRALLRHYVLGNAEAPIPEGSSEIEGYRQLLKDMMQDHGLSRSEIRETIRSAVGGKLVGGELGREDKSRLFLKALDQIKSGN